MSVYFFWKLFLGLAHWNLQCQHYVQHWESLGEELGLELWGSDGSYYCPDLTLKPRNLQIVSEGPLQVPHSFMYRNLLCSCGVAEELPAEEHQRHFLLSPNSWGRFACWSVKLSELAFRGGIPPRTLDTSSAATPGHASGVEGHVALSLYRPFACLPSFLFSLDFCSAKNTQHQRQVLYCLHSLHQ